MYTKVTTNKNAYHNYFISDCYEAGIVLEGSEVKSIRNGNMNLSDSFVVIKNGEVYLKNAYIKQYEQVNSFSPNEKKDRKLLLHKDEILKLNKKVNEKTYTIVATKAYIKDRKVKIEIALAKGKKLYDKKEDLKIKSIELDMQREIKKYQ